MIVKEKPAQKSMTGVLYIPYLELPIETSSIAELKTQPALAPVSGEGFLLLSFTGIQCKVSAG